MNTTEIFNNIKNVRIDDQPEFEQVGVWFDLYDKPVSICYQNGDMSGERIGIAIFNNPGADTGPDEILEVLSERPEFQQYIDKSTYWQYESLKELINEFLNEFSAKNGIDKLIRRYAE